MKTGEEIAKLAVKHGIQFELGAQYSIRGQIAQLINLVEEITKEQDKVTRHACADECSLLAGMMECGAGELEAGVRLRQAARNCINVKAV